MRQHSAVHEQTVTELLSHGSGKPNYRTWTSLSAEMCCRRRCRRVSRYFPTLSNIRRDQSELRIMQPPRKSIKAMPRGAAQPHHLQDRCSKRHAGASPDAATGGVAGSGDPPRLHVNIIPLFETIEDLRGCAAIMDELFSIPYYRKLLNSRGNTQEVMLVILTATRTAATSRQTGSCTKPNWNW